MDPLEKATQADAPAILALYRSMIGAPGCTWNEYYPGMEEIAADLAAASLYCLRDESGQILSTAFAGLDEKIPELPWNPAIRHPCALARIAVRRSCQHRGIASDFLRAILAEMPKRGFDGMCLLVSKTNLPAMKLYRRHGFVFRGETRQYDLDFYWCEKLLSVPEEPAGS